MLQNNYTNLNFKAKFIQNTSVLEYNKKNKNYDKALVSFVEIKPCYDTIAISNAVKNWENDTYACNILNTLKRQNKNFDNLDNFKIYALTSQKRNFEILSSNMILALAQIELEGNKTPYLSYLQVNPDNIEQFAFYNERKYKGVGTGFLNSLKKIYDSISLVASNRGLDYFYTKNNFDLVSTFSKKYLWKK